MQSLVPTLRVSCLSDEFSLCNIAYVAKCTTTYNQCVKDNKRDCSLVSCPNNCRQSSGDVFGWQIYSGESSICTAAVQAGLISSASPSRILYLISVHRVVHCVTFALLFCAGMTVIGVVSLEGRSFYSSANNNGILSKSQASCTVSFRFRSSLKC